MPKGHKCKGRRVNGTIKPGFALTKWGLFSAGSAPAALKPKRKKAAAKPKVARKRTTAKRTATKANVIILGATAAPNAKMGPAGSKTRSGGKRRRRQITDTRQGNLL